MKLALVCPYGLDRPGGVQGQVIGLARALASDHEVRVVAPGTEVPPALAANVPTTLVGPTVGVRANGSVAPITLAPAAVRRVRAAIRSFAPDVAFVHEPLVPVVGIGAVGAAPTVATFHRAGVTSAFRLAAPLGRVVGGRLAAGVVVSEAARATIRTLVGRRAAEFLMIPNGVDTARFSPVTGTRSPHALVFVGRHEPRKGLGVLLEALERLPESFVLTVVGEGPETPGLRARYADSRVRWLGRAPDAVVADEVAHAGMFVAPSLRGESFGVVLLEAMAAGVPVVCSDLAGYRLAAGSDAVYVAPGDADALGAAIATLAADDVARRRLAERGIERARAHDFGVVAAEYAALAAAVASRSSAS